MKLEDWSLNQNNRAVGEMIEKHNNSLSHHNGCIFITVGSKIDGEAKNYHFRNFKFEKEAHSKGERANYPLSSEKSGRWEI